MRQLSRLVLATALSLGVLVPCEAARADDIRIGAREPAPRTPGAVRLATYNIENLFDDKDDPSLSGDIDDMLSVKPEPEKRALAATLRRMDADIIALQEIESYDALIEFREAFVADMGYDHVMSIDVGEHRGIENAVISRFPIVEARVWPNMVLGGVHPELFRDRPNMYAGQPLVMRRSPLFVTVEVPAGAVGNAEPYRLHLFVVHHKSGRGNEYWREAEARKIVGLVRDLEQRDSQANIAVLGDFNATPDEPSVRIYAEAGLIDLHHDRADDATGYTHSSERTIDFIFVNPNLKREIHRESLFLLGTPMIPQGADWRTTPRPEGYASDHLPVVVDLTPADR